MGAEAMYGNKCPLRLFFFQFCLFGLPFTAFCSRDPQDCFIFPCSPVSDKCRLQTGTPVSLNSALVSLNNVPVSSPAGGGGGGGTPWNFWWGCTARISKSRPNFIPNNAIFTPVFRPGLKNPYPFSDLTLHSICISAERKST